VTAEKPFTLQAVPSVKVIAQYYDGKGKKTSGHEVRLYGSESDEAHWQTYGVPAADGRVELLAPRGLQDATMRPIMDEHCSLRCQKSADSPLQPRPGLKLGNLDNDLTDIHIVRYVAPVLLVKPTSADGKPLDSVEVIGRYADASIEYPVYFQRQKDGRHRSWQLLPDEKFTITVTAPGHRPQSRTVSLAEGTTSELALELAPR
jgi:hypothetical protein